MNHQKLSFLLIAFCAVHAVVPRGAAQAPPAGGPSPEEAALDAARTRTSIPANEPAIDGWITYRLARLTAGIANPNPGEDAVADFLGAFRKEAANSANSKDFNNRLAEQSGKRFAAEFQKGPELEPTLAMALGQALLVFDNTAVMEGVSAGLKVKARSTVRYYSAKALAQLIPAIQADERLTGIALQLLRETASTETSPPVLSQMFEAMAYKERFSAALPIMLDVLEAQLRRRAKESPGADGAAESLFAFLKREQANIQDKGRLVNLLAIHLRLDVERYAVPGISEEERWVIARTIDVVEGMLVQLAGPPSPAPNVRDAMKKVVNADINMPLELFKWIGTAQNRGFLNEAPWNVPVGAPLAG